MVTFIRILFLKIYFFLFLFYIQTKEKKSLTNILDESKITISLTLRLYFFSKIDKLSMISIQYIKIDYFI